MSVIEIPLTRGIVAVIDQCDHHLIPGRWQVQDAKTAHTFYAKQTYENSEGRTVSQFMHRLITAAPPRIQVDHKNHNGLDNRRENLRVCTGSQNMANTGPRVGRFKGVDFCQNKRAWRAQFSQRFLGHYDTEEEAAIAYNVAAYSAHGEFAYLNRIDGLTFDQLLIQPIKRCVFSSRLKGVSQRANGKWRAYVYINGRQQTVATNYGSEQEAFDARQAYLANLNGMSFMEPENVNDSNENGCTGSEPAQPVIASQANDAW